MKVINNKKEDKMESWKKLIKKKISAEDRFQKTWIPEGTKEYAFFKLITQENLYLSQYLKHQIPLKKEDLLLDVGGRQGDIVFSIQDPEYVHIVDPDPTLIIHPKPRKFFRSKIQNTDLGKAKYKIIISSHVWGYLGLEDVQKNVFDDLIKNHLKEDGTFVLFYNTNSGYMGELLEFAKENLTLGHFDYFDEKFLDKYTKDPSFQIESTNVSFDLNYSSFKELSRCCWFLFGAIDQDIEGVSNIFLSKLKKDLRKPHFPIEERLTIIKKIE